MVLRVGTGVCRLEIFINFAPDLPTTILDAEDVPVVTKPYPIQQCLHDLRAAHYCVRPCHPSHMSHSPGNPKRHAAFIMIERQLVVQPAAVEWTSCMWAPSCHPKSQFLS